MAQHAAFRYARWDLSMIVLVLYNCIMIPMEIAFELGARDGCAIIQSRVGSRHELTPPLTARAPLTAGPRPARSYGWLNITDYNIDSFFWVPPHSFIFTHPMQLGRGLDCIDAFFW